MAKITGTSGNDVITPGGNNPPSIVPLPSDAADTIKGLAGDDQIQGGGGKDSLDGGDGVDLLFGNEGSDKVSGGSGNDILYGDQDNDTLDGGDGDDQLDGGDGKDVLKGGDGDDEFQVRGIEAQSDSFDGGKGIDTIVNDSAGDVTFETFNAKNIEVFDNTGTLDSLAHAILGTDGNNTLNFAGLSLLGVTSIDGGLGNDKLTGSDDDNTIVGGAGNDTLDGGGGADDLDGGADKDNLKGGDGNDTLQGGAGNDTIDGGADNDVIDGGADKDNLKGGDGDDVFLIRGDEAATDSFDGGKGTDEIHNDSTGDVTLSKFKPTNIEVFDNTGTDLADHAIVGTTGNDNLNFKGLTLLGVTSIDGLDGNDTLTGSDDDNVIVGGLGKDKMTGGGGDDTFYVDDFGDKVSENKNGGNDTVIIDDFTAGKAFTLFNNVENLTIDDGVAISATGNAIENVIVAGTGEQTLDGAGGDDTLTGGGDADTFVMSKSMGDDVIIDFEVGTDLLDFSKLGYDSAQVLGALTQTVDGAFFDFGSNGSVLLKGVDGADLGLDDFITKPLGTTPIEGDDTANTIPGTTGKDVIIGWDGDDSLSGGDGNDTLVGGFGNDTLDGGTGSDSLLGGDGDDTYIVDKGGDKITEVADGGTDTVESSATYTLAANVENLILTGSGKINGTGNELDNAITGNGANNTLKGQDGDDTLSGGDGNDNLQGGNDDDSLLGGDGKDTLQGGNGEDVLIGGADADKMTGGKDADVFVYESVGDSGIKANGDPIDTITDFKSGEDHIDLTLLPLVGTFSVSTDMLHATGDAEALFKGGLLSIDIDGDGSSDLDIAMSGLKSIDLGDFFT